MLIHVCRHVYRHVHRCVHRHMCKHVYRDMYWHMYRHVYRHVYRNVHRSPKARAAKKKRQSLGPDEIAEETANLVIPPAPDGTGPTAEPQSGH